MHGTIEYRPVQRADLPQVNQLEQAAFSAPHYPYYFFRQAYDLWPALFWVAAMEDEILGYAVGANEQHNLQRVCLLSFAIMPKAQGQGLANKLLAAWLRAMPTESAIWLTVAPDNITAINLYQRHGFKQIAMETDYFGAEQDRLILEKSGAP